IIRPMPSSGREGRPAVIGPAIIGSDRGMEKRCARALVPWSLVDHVLGLAGRRRGDDRRGPAIAGRRAAKRRASMASLSSHLAAHLAQVRREGLFKPERVLPPPQGPSVTAAPPAGQAPSVAINLCANNYLGPANHPRIVAAAHAALDRYGFGLSSVRFICGTQ